MFTHCVVVVVVVVDDDHGVGNGIKITLTKARFKRLILHVPNLMQMRKVYCFRSFALHSAHVKYYV